ncbi:MAG TPA: hypothetical protein VMX94_03245 [Armatimonadota bacterium]|nr:hypothetical protein [Armatimonadota bacterium]
MEKPGVTKKQQIIRLYDRGFDVESIADPLATNPTYVANTLIQSAAETSNFELPT